MKNLFRASCFVGSSLALFLMTMPVFSQAPQSQNRTREHIVILGTNDLHGAMVPSPVEGSAAERGGLAVLAGQINTLRNEYGSRLVFVDAGDQWQGTLESNSAEGAPIVEALNAMRLQAAAIGNHEFDFGPVGPHSTPPEQASGPLADSLGALKERIRQARYPYLSANLLDGDTHRHLSVHNLRSNTILQAGNVRIGVIGLTTEETPTTTYQRNVRGLEFANLAQTTLRQAQSLRARGAQVILLLAHVGTRCAPLSPSEPLEAFALRSPSTPQGECRGDSEIERLLSTLPQGTVDAIVGGHVHQLVHHWVRGVPIIQSAKEGRFFHLIQLTYDHRARRLVHDETQIEGPIPVSLSALHGRPVQVDSQVGAIVAAAQRRTEEVRRRVVGQAARPIQHVDDRESELADLVTDAMKDKVNAEVALVNSHGIRVNQWPAGDITYGQIFRTLPFDNFISLIQITGAQLRSLLRAATAGSHGIFDPAGLWLQMVALSGPPLSRDDLNGDGQILPFEYNRLVSARLQDGSEIQDERIYRLATVDFIAQGGDDSGWAIRRIPNSQIDLQAGGLLRDAVEDYVRRIGTLNSTDRPLIDAAHPRVEVVPLPPSH